MKRVIPITPHGAWESGICGRCVSPGSCCKRFNVSDSEGEPRTFWDDEPPKLADGYPFKAVERWGQWTVEFGPDTGRTFSAWLFSCTKVSDDGRCTIYEDRPALCRTYEPLTDRLCAMTKPSENSA